jgi:hypothetical protein
VHIAPQISNANIWAKNEYIPDILGMIKITPQSKTRIKDPESNGASMMPKDRHHRACFKLHQSSTESDE